MKSKSINKITVINIISTFIIQGIAFFTIPIFTRLLGTSQFGIYSLFNAWVSICTCFMGLSMTSAVGNGMYHFKREYKIFRNSILLGSTLICIIQVFVIVILSCFIKTNQDFTSSLVFFIGLMAMCNYIIFFAQNVFIFEKKAVLNLIMSVFLSLSSVLLSIFLIFKQNDENKYMGRVYGVGISYLIVAIVVFFLLFLEKPTFIHKKYFMYGVQVGLPMIFHSLSLNVLIQSDRVMMEILDINSSEIGIYSLFYSLCNVLNIVQAALNKSWSPFYFDDISKDNEEIATKKCKRFIEIFTVITVGFVLLSREIVYLMADSSYWSGMRVIPFLVLGMYFAFMYQLPVTLELYYKKTKLIAMGTVIAGILNIILNYSFIPKYGMYGASIATAISYLFLFLLHFIIVSLIGNKKYHLSLKTFVPGIVVVIISIYLFYILADWWYIRWALGAIVGILEVAIIYKRKSIF